MNYGKKKASNKQKKISSNKNMKKKRIGVRFFKALLICMLLVMILGAAGVGLFVKRIIDDTPTVTPEDVRPSGYTTFVYAQDGTELERFVSSGANRIYKKIDTIPDNLAHAFIAIEDERFYEHNGIDLQGILRAGVVGITSGNFSEGASTLTQQLIKNNVFPNFTEEKTFYDRLERKLQEQFLAVEIEKQMSKDEVLEAYMNTINLGQNCLGVQSAALRYFNKDVSELNLSECAAIAGITQSPSNHNPITNPESNKKRRDKVLKNMLDQGFITKEAYDEAIADDVYSRIQTTNAAVTEEKPYTYFIDALTEQVIEDLQNKKGYTYTQAYNALYSGGLTIKATQDLGIQQICDEEVANNENYPWLIEYGVEFVATVTRADGTVENYSTEMLRKFLSDTRGGKYPLIFSSPEEAQQAVNEYKTTLNVTENDTYDERLSINPQPQTSVVIMDQYTGQVKAIVGGRGDKKSSLSLNRATDSPRQPGSCFKVLSTYLPALDACGYTLATATEDSPFNYEDGTPVRNWWGANSYKGNFTVRRAIEQSANVVTVKVLSDIGPQIGYDYLRRLHFSTLVDGNDPNFPGYSDIQLPTALGGITRGVYNLEMTAAYAAIANNGVYTKPILYTEILDHDGNVLLENTPDTEQVMQSSTAALLTNAMIDVVTQGTGTRARLGNMPVSGKTGTSTDSSNGSVDIWFSAFTPYYTCSVWGGYDANKPLSNTSWHLDLWRSIMTRIHANLEYRDFVMPPEIEQKTICTESGMLATGSCPGLTEYFAPGTAPSQSCYGHYVEPDPEEETEENGENGENGENNGDTPPEGGDVPPPSEGGGDTPPEDGGDTPPDGGGDAPPADGGGDAPPAEG